MVGDETQCRKGKCTKDADPRQGFRSQVGFENKVEAYCYGNRQNREDTLPQGQAKEHRLTVVPDFSVDFYFHTVTSLTGGGICVLLLVRFGVIQRKHIHTLVTDFLLQLASRHAVVLAVTKIGICPIR